MRSPSRSRSRSPHKSSKRRSRSPRRRSPERRRRSHTRSRSEDEYTDIFDRARENLDLGVDMMVTEEKVIEEKAEVDGVDVKPSIIIRKKHHPDVLAFFREELIERRTRWHEKTAIMLNSRLQFEEQIKRPYFDVKKMEAGQLKNWREYLDYEIEEGIEDRVETLFERCVIACALYDTMSLKYAQWVSKRKGISAARKIFERSRVHYPESSMKPIKLEGIRLCREFFDGTPVEEFDAKQLRILASALGCPRPPRGHPIQSAIAAIQVSDKVLVFCFNKSSDCKLNV